jgi:hypothetical protein
MRTTRAGDRHGEALLPPTLLLLDHATLYGGTVTSKGFKTVFFLVVYFTSVDLYERDKYHQRLRVGWFFHSFFQSFHCTCPWPGARRRRLSSSFCRTSGALSHRMRKIVRAERLTAADSGCEGKTRCQSASPPHAGGAARQRPRSVLVLLVAMRTCRFIWTEYQR